MYVQFSNSSLSKSDVSMKWYGMDDNDDAMRQTPRDNDYTKLVSSVVCWGRKSVLLNNTLSEEGVDTHIRTDLCLDKI